MSLKKVLDSVREFFFGRSRKLDGHVAPPTVTTALTPPPPPPSTGLYLQYAVFLRGF